MVVKVEGLDLDSPALTGTPSLPTGTTGVTQTASDNSTKIATTAYADAAGGGGLANIVEDVTPQLGAALDMNTFAIQASNAAGPTIVDEAALGTNPTLIPNKADLNTGVGWTSADRMSLIAGGVSQMEVYESAGIGQVILPQQNATTTPTLAFGDGDTGFYEQADDQLAIVIGTTANWILVNGKIRSGVATGPAILNEAATSTNPTFVPNNADDDTGIGWAAANELSLITGAVEAVNIDANQRTTVTDLVAPANFNAQTGTAYTGVIGDAEIVVTMNNAAANTFTIPANASVAYDVGTKITVMQLGAGATTIAITTDTLNADVNYTLVLSGQHSVVTCLKMSATTWNIFGGLTLLGVAGGGPQLQTPTTTTTGTAHAYTSIPSWVKRITIMFNGISTSGSSELILQLGDTGGFETTGYNGASSGIATVVATTAHSSGFRFRNDHDKGYIYHGTLILTLLDSTNNVWTVDGNVSRSDAASFGAVSGSKTLTAALTQIRLTTAIGTDTFDGGSFNVSWE